jgi:hypothetical protein
MNTLKRFKTRIIMEIHDQEIENNILKMPKNLDCPWFWLKYGMIIMHFLNYET